MQNQNEIRLAELQSLPQLGEPVLNGKRLPAFTLPDRVLAAALLLEGNAKAVFYGATIESALVISLSAFEHFVRSVLRFKDGAIGVWLRVDTVSALELIAALGAPGKKRHFRGFLANALMLPEPLGIFAPCRAAWDSGGEVSRIEEVFDDYCPFPGLTEKQGGSAPPAGELAQHLAAFSLRTAGRAKTAAQKAGAGLEFPADRACPADLFFRAASELKSLGAFDGAIDFCSSAIRFDHPKAKDLLNRIQSEASKPLRDAYPEVFDQILRGDRLRALTVLRQLAGSRNDALPVLAYCLRQTNSPAEGLDICDRSLAVNRNQPDVLAHRWSYLTELHRDAEALTAAREHILRFPQDESATVNALDSALLLGRAEDARLLLARYAAFSSNLELTLRHYFKTYEQLGRWEELADEYERTLPLLHAPSAETLCRYGETLIEIERFDECFNVFERALAIEPGNAKVILGFARALARCEREHEAEALLETGLGDRTRVDIDADRLFIIALLAEIRRRTGKPAQALETFGAYVAGDLVEMSSFAGPIPALEYAESLLALGRTAEAEEIAAKLKTRFPDDPFVDELAGLCAGS